MSDYFQMKVTLEYEGKEYSFENSNFMQDGDCFWWEEGNGACDCNRSLYIQRHCDEKFPEMECGDKIELIGVEPLFQYSREPLFINGTWHEALR